MYEYKKVTCFKNEMYLIEAHLDFGWEVFSTQEVHSGREIVKGVDSRVTTYENRIDIDTKVNTKYESTDYTVIVFRRDTNMPHYKEVVALENSFSMCGGYDEFNDFNERF